MWLVLFRESAGVSCYPLFCSWFTLKMNHLLIFFHGEDRVRSVNITYRRQEREYGAHSVRRKMLAVYVKTNLNVCHFNETNINWQSVCQNFRSLFLKKVPECSPTFACMSKQVHKKDTPWPLGIEVAIRLLDLLDFYKKVWSLGKVYGCLTVKEWMLQEEPGQKYVSNCISNLTAEPKNSWSWKASLEII